MKLIKMFGLAAIAAVAAMAFVGASSASATLNTLLCKTHTEPCNSLPASVHFVAGTTVLKTSIVTVLCLGSLVVATPLGLGTAPARQVFHNTALTWTACGTNVAHNNCTVTTIKPGLVNVLRTALNLGIALVEGAEVKVVCGEVLSCTYGGPTVGEFAVEGALHTAEAGHGKLSANELTVPVVGGLLCPATSKWTASFEALEHLFLVG